jgi:hypothetical protein
MNPKLQTWAHVSHQCKMEVRRLRSLQQPQPRLNKMLEPQSQTHVSQQRKMEMEMVRHQPQPRLNKMLEPQSQTHVSQQRKMEMEMVRHPLQQLPPALCRHER